MTTTPSPTAATLRERMVRKIRGLLALAHQRDNRHEAERAAERANLLMREHLVTLDEVNGTTPTSVGAFDVKGNFEPAWRMALLTFISQVHHGRAFRIYQPTATRQGFWKGQVVARHEDRETIVALFHYFEAKINEIVREGLYDTLGPVTEESYRRGVVYGLQGRIERRFRRAPPTDPNHEKSVALAVSEKHLAAEAGKAANAKFRGVEVVDYGRAKDAASFRDGTNDAARIPMPEDIRRIEPDRAGQTRDSDRPERTGTRPDRTGTDLDRSRTRASRR